MGASVSLVGYGFGVCVLRFVLFFGGGVGGMVRGVFNCVYISFSHSKLLSRFRSIQ